MAKRKSNTKKINLALQGGGAHGAFTWGALERLLGDDRVDIAGMSGTSAGALNGAAVKSGLAAGVKYGLSDGGRGRALDNLQWFWSQVGAVTDPAIEPWLNAVSPAVISSLIEASLPFAVSDTLSRVVSPYNNPVYSNPLRPIVERFQYDDVCCSEGPDLTICATNVRTGKIRLFSGEEITPEALMASACLPTLFQAVEMHCPDSHQTEAYWDGGYTGNPALYPLFSDDLPADIVVININPLYRPEVPKTARAIQNRINEISFNTSLLRELRAIDFVQRLLDEGRIPEGAMRRLRVHMVADDDLMGQLSVATKLVPTPQVLYQLYEAGWNAADTFLSSHFDQIGTESSVDLRAMFS